MQMIKVYVNLFVEKVVFHLCSEAKVMVDNMDFSTVIWKVCGSKSGMKNYALPRKHLRNLTKQSTVIFARSTVNTSGGFNERCAPDCCRVSDLLHQAQTVDPK